MKILIAVPCMDQVPVPFAYALAVFEKAGECTLSDGSAVKWESTLSMKTGALVYNSRDDLATFAIMKEYDYVMWLDSDMSFPPDTINRLLKTMLEKDLDILSGLYFRRHPPYTPVHFDKLEMNGEECDFEEMKQIPEGLVECGAVGLGCCLMKTDVFFDVQGRFRMMFAPIGKNGEDVAFCWRARQCGYKVWCDPSIICGHVAYSTVDDKFFKAFSDQKK